MKLSAIVSLLAMGSASAFTVKTPTQVASSTRSQPTSLHMESSRRSILSTAAVALSTAAALTIDPQPSQARLEAVNRPDLLPSDAGAVVIQTEKFLTSGQAKRMSDLIRALEKDTGFRLRVLCQNYPNTPGLAIRDFWSLGKEDQMDDKYIVLVVDQFGGKGNVLNFNVGEGVKFALPNVFWTRLSGKYGTTFFVRENGIDFAITNAVEAIVQCLRSEDAYCVNVPDQGVSMKKLGL
eukprot:CAMPEP_0197239442 /NCGR_PEP_ID=MMETSP1429-20130617/5912_1 /TAXON_ID=49237 /ORGANISM="Chaetoceros  sp., Strain UNC1202" /LENGTH=236 /DNA_ID=CAMNT_0042698857 /DNA_START=17 /DNA_END=727 /DNA_ORIENTATION=+